MGIPRRFLNLIVSNQIPGVRSLCCIDLTRQQLFHPTTRTTTIGGGSESSTTQTPAADAALKMEMVRLPRPSYTFRASASALNDQPKIDCFPLPDFKMICTDQLGRAFHFDAQTRLVGTMPCLHKPKSKPFSLFVPNSDADDKSDFFSLFDPNSDADNNCDRNGGGGGTLFVMERIPKPEVGCCEQYSDQFEAFVYRNSDRKRESASYHKSWYCQLLPPPSYVREPKYWHRSPEIISYAVLDGGSHICISVKGVGTYWMDTVSHTWEHVGNWMLPFYGKVEYVPELKLWFGLSGEDRHLAAADLSDMGSQSQPQLVSPVSPWKEFDPPEEWKECKDSQLINLGSGKFCIARFFHSRTLNGNFGDELVDQNFAVFTGVEVVLLVHDANSSCSANVNGGNGKVRVQMIPHISRCHESNGTAIDACF